MSGGPNEWVTPGTIIGMIGLIAAAGATYSRVDGRVSVAEANSVALEKRLDALDRKIDWLIQQQIKPRADDL